ncbi:MAG: endonuclease domain-containing protein [Pirellulaceae bacterium]
MKHKTGMSNQSLEFRDHMIERARKLRADQTGPETRLWYCLRNNQLAGLKFRRQRPVGKFVADFYCSEHRLIVELDGNFHDETNWQTDTARQAWLESNGFKVLRFENDEVVKDIDCVLEAILIACGKRV